MADDLNQNRIDALVATAKSALGLVPFAGPLLSELVGNLIPNQRIDRLTKYAKELEERLSVIERKKIELAFKTNEGIDLIEESFVQASRAITDERREYIASVVANGLDDEEIEYLESKFILKLLQELNDQEIIWLRYFMVPTVGGDQDFRDKHKNVLYPIDAYLGSDNRKSQSARAVQRTSRASRAY